MKLTGLCRAAGPAAERRTVQRSAKAVQAGRAVQALRAAGRSLRGDIGQSVGQPLDAGLRAHMESRLGGATPAGPADAFRDYRRAEAQADDLARGGGNGAGPPRYLAGVGRAVDFSAVRLHADSRAASAARRLRARAFTLGDHIYADPLRLPAAGDDRTDLLAHELAHVVQQRRAGVRAIQPRLLATGTAADIERFIVMAEAAMGEDLEHDPLTNEITAVATLANPPTSPAFAAAMHRIIDDPAQDAEAHFGTGQDRVAVGAFPNPADMTGSTEQRIDMDDVEAIETGAPGNGLGKLAHELTENYQAHAAPAVAGTSRFPAAHDAGVSAESDVAEDTVGPGRRVADVDTPVVGTTFTRVQDFENYYLVFDLTRAAGSLNFTVSNARQAPRVNVLTVTIDQYVTGSAVMPAAGAANVAAAAAAVAANNSATVRIEGFTDNVGAAVTNVILSNNRAAGVRAALQAAGVAGGRMHAVGLASTNPVAPNNTEANRARNRRVTIIVDRPGP